MAMKFHDLDLEKLNKQENSRADFLVLEEGNNLVRVLPPWAQGELYYFKYKVHFGLDQLQQYGLATEWMAETCLEEKEGKCPVCALAVQAKVVGIKEKETDLVELSKRLRAKNQYLTNVVNMDVPEDGVRILQYGKKVHDGLKSIFQRKGNITHPEKGRNVVIVKQSTGNKWFDYSVSLDDVVSIANKWEEWGEGLFNLRDVPNYSEYEAIAEKCAAVEFESIGGTSQEETATLDDGEFMDFSSPPKEDSKSAEEVLDSLDDNI